MIFILILLAIFITWVIFFLNSPGRALGQPPLSKELFKDKEKIQSSLSFLEFKESIKQKWFENCNKIELKSLKQQVSDFIGQFKVYFLVNNDFDVFHEHCKHVDGNEILFYEALFAVVQEENTCYTDEEFRECFNEILSPVMARISTDYTKRYFNIS